MTGVVAWIPRGLVLAALVAGSACTAAKSEAAHINPSGTGMGFLTLAGSGSVAGDYRVVVNGLDDTSSPTAGAGASASNRVSIDVTISVSAGHYQYSAADFTYKRAHAPANAPAIPADPSSSPNALPAAGALNPGQSVTGTLTFNAPPGQGQVEFNDPMSPQASAIWSVP
jgi:hypothetical protein